MTDERLPRGEPDELGPADEEELRSAAALARVLEGGRDEPDLPEDALAAAALLRLSAGSARLGEGRQREIRDELLRSLRQPEPAARRRLRFGWLLPLLPIASVAAVYLLSSWGEREGGAGTLRPRAAQERASAEAAPGTAPAAAARPALSAASRGEAAADRQAGAAEPGIGEQRAPLASGARRALTEDMARDARELRRSLLARAGDGALARAHAQLDAAGSRPELERSRQTLVDLSESLGDADDGDGRLIRQDLYCRLAETALRLGEPRAALEWTRRGLALDGPPTPFLAQLEALEGDAWAALGDDERAARGYMKALGVHEKLLDEDLDGR